MQPIVSHNFFYGMAKSSRYIKIYFIVEIWRLANFFVIMILVNCG